MVFLALKNFILQIFVILLATLPSLQYSYYYNFFLIIPFFIVALAPSGYFLLWLIKLLQVDDLPQPYCLFFQLISTMWISKQFIMCQRLESIILRGKDYFFQSWWRTQIKIARWDKKIATKFMSNRPKKRKIKNWVTV